MNVSAGLSRDLIEEIFDSVNGWSVGFMNLLQMILGTPLIDISGLEKRLQLERSKYLVADLKEAFDDNDDEEETAEGKVPALCRYILHKEDGKAEGKVPPIPYRFGIFFIKNQSSHMTSAIHPWFEHEN